MALIASALGSRRVPAEGLPSAALGGDLPAFSIPSSRPWLLSLLVA